MREEQYCDKCGRLIGIMSVEAFNARDRLCEECIYEKEKFSSSIGYQEHFSRRGKENYL